MAREFHLTLGRTVVTVIDVGAAIRSVQLCDRSGQVDDVVLGHPTVEDYKVPSNLKSAPNGAFKSVFS